MCDAAVSDLIDRYAHREHQPHLWSKPHCKGAEYPTKNGFSLMGEKHPVEFFMTEDIQSLYVPHHVVLQLFSEVAGAQPLSAEIPGPTTVKSLEAYYLNWDVEGVQNPTNPLAGTRVHGNQITHLRFARPTSWSDTMIRSSVKGGLPLTPKVYDDFYASHCAGASASKPECTCVQQHMESPSRFVDGVNDCDHTRHYVPSTARAAGSGKRCAENIRDEIQRGTWSYIDHGGPKKFDCGEHRMENVFEMDGRYEHPSSPVTLLNVILAIVSILALIGLYHAAEPRARRLQSTGHLGHFGLRRHHR